MESTPKNADERAWAYASVRGLKIRDALGRGLHGCVLSSSGRTAIKAHNTDTSYTRELACYNRLRERNISEICGHHVPQYIGCDDTLWVIEMAIVTPPFLLDFAGAYLDWPPEFPPETMEYWHHEKQEQFGTRWKEVQNILAMLSEQAEIYMLDVNPGNIMFADGEI